MKLDLNHSLRAKQLLTASIATFILSGCGSSSNNDNNTADDTGEATETPVDNTETATGSTEPFSSLQVDASSYDSYTYVNLITGEALELTDAEAENSSDWHLGFSRTNVKINGGASGPGDVSAAMGVSQDDFYDAEGNPDNNVFLNATADSEEDHLLAEIDTSALTFSQDENTAAIAASEETIGTTIDMGWYFYDFTSHVTSLNSETYWLLRSAAGDSFAKFNATAFNYDRETGLDVTFNFDVQPAGTSQFSATATFNAHVDAAGGSDCFDFDANTTISCDSADWDLKLEIAGRSWTLWTNSGVSGNGSGGAFGPFDSAGIADYSAGDVTSEGVSIVNHYAADKSAGVFSENSWYAYNLQDAHKLWPNYRTYVVDTNTSDENAPVFKLQITNYYSNIGSSGYPTIRFVAQ